MAFKVVIGGLAVVAFSLLGQAGHPKRFSGLFAAAPSVALASRRRRALYFLFRESGLFIKQDQLVSNSR